MSKGIEFIKNMGKYSVPSLVSAILGIIVIPFITKMFPADAYGKIDMFYSIGNTVSMFVMLGFDSCFFRYYNEPPIGYNCSRLFRVSVFVSLLVAIVTFIVAILFFEKKMSALLSNIL